MPKVLDPFRFLLIAVAGWMNQHQFQIIDYLREENGFFANNWVGGACVSTTTSAVAWPRRPKDWAGSFLAEVATIVTPETLLAWHRKLIAQKNDGSGKRGPGRPRTAGEIEALVVRIAAENRDWG